MEQPAQLDLRADRHVRFAETLAFVDHDFSDATFAMQVREQKDGGELLVDLSTVTDAAAEGVRLIAASSATLADHIAAGRIDEVPTGYDATETVVISEVGIRIAEASMAALPYPPVRGGEQVLVWDMVVATAPGEEDVIAGGKFIIRAGVTE